MAKWLCPSALTVAALLACASGYAAETVEFSGEILLAAPPPGWSVRGERRANCIVAKTYEAPFRARARWHETVTFETILGDNTTSLEEVEQAIYAKYRERCAEVDAQPAEPVPGGVHESVLISLLCLAPKGMSPDASTGNAIEAAFVMVKVMRGEFNGYRIERVWRGPLNSAAMPANSNGRQSNWMNYFATVRVCNTLVENCDLRSLPSADSNPRFRTMREAAVSVKPVIDIVLVLDGAEKIGRLTGQAELCGEDVSVFLSKIDRMFEFVTANEDDKAKALETFRKALTGGRNTALGNAPACGDTLNDFRAHPTRPGRFPNFINRVTR